jgi:hypothetical protein
MYLSEAEHATSASIAELLQQSGHQHVFFFLTRAEAIKRANDTHFSEEVRFMS